MIINILQRGLAYGLLVFSLMYTGCTPPQSIAPFSSDLCSCYPEGTKNDPHIWEHCCVAHDSAYWKGGTSQERLSADSLFFECVAQVQSPKKAQIMYHAVRIGGTPYIPTPFRWGYGWHFFRGYKALSNQEIDSVKATLERQ